MFHSELTTQMQFQFHKGTIRTDTPNGNLSHYSNFNSIKVRLELVLLEYTKPKDVLFQFHKGTIRTEDSSDTEHPACSFQFHKGTIRTEECDMFWSAPGISIP